MSAFTSWSNFCYMWDHCSNWLKDEDEKRSDAGIYLFISTLRSAKLHISNGTDTEHSNMEFLGA
jgi:hypothetical protein